MPVTFERDGGTDTVGHLELDAGELNLLSPDTIAHLHTVVGDVPDDIAILTITGGGEGLTAGLDLDAVQDFSTADARPVIRELHDAMAAVRDLDAVTVCGCGAYALGAGLELAMSCDIRVAAEDAALGLPEVDVGLVTGIQGGLLIRLVGEGRATELIYTGEPVKGTRAADIGLVTRAVPAADHDDTLDELTEQLARIHPDVLRRQRAVFRDWRSTGLEDGIEASVESIADCFGTAAQREGMAAFLDG